jgi:hypothetical protein
MRTETTGTNEDAITWVEPFRWPRPMEAFFESDDEPRPSVIAAYMFGALAGAVMLVAVWIGLDTDRWFTRRTWEAVAWLWAVFTLVPGTLRYCVWAVAWLVDAVWPPVVVATVRGIAHRGSFTPYADLLSPLTIVCRGGERSLKTSGPPMGEGLVIAETIDVLALKALIERGGKRVVLDVGDEPAAAGD